MSYRFRAFRSLRMMCFLVCFGSAALAATGTKPDNAAPAPQVSAGYKGTAKPVTVEAPGKPMWVELTPAQQQALSPLAAEWDKLALHHKKKWLAISAKYPSLKPEQQVRLQERMRDWAKLTPEQRAVARESYARAKKLDPGQKSVEWQQYQQLPEEQKKKLASEAAAKKRVTNLPPVTQSKPKVTPPPKPKGKTGVAATPLAAAQPPAHPAAAAAPAPAPGAAHAPAIAPEAAPAGAPSAAK